jgi:acyl-CoA thioesterase-1
LFFGRICSLKKTTINKLYGNVSISFIEEKGMKNKTKLTALLIVTIILVSPLAVSKIISLQHSRVPVASVGRLIRVACVGDSITKITGYPSKLQLLLGSNFTVGNFGATGSTVLLNSWKPYMNQSEFQNAKDFEPDIIVVMLGTNDDLRELEPFNASFEEDYATLISSFQNLPNNPEIFIANSPPIFSNSSDLNPSYLTETIIPQTNDLANQLNLPIIDIYSSFGNRSDYFVDGVHPNSDGAALIANDVFDAIDPYNLAEIS